LLYFCIPSVALLNCAVYINKKWHLVKEHQKELPTLLAPPVRQEQQKVSCEQCFDQWELAFRVNLPYKPMKSKGMAQFTKHQENSGHFSRDKRAA
jgi:hypothetical protein